MIKVKRCDECKDETIISKLNQVKIKRYNPTRTIKKLCDDCFIKYIKRKQEIEKELGIK